MLPIDLAAVVAATAPVDRVQLFDQTWLPIIGMLIAAITAALLILTFWKTVDISRANQQSAAAAAIALDEMRAQRDAETAPYVAVRVDLHDRMVFFVVENLGKSAAHDIQLTFTPSLPEALFLQKPLPVTLTEVIPTLAPGQQMRALVNVGPVVFSLGEEGLPLRYEATVVYTGGISSESRKERYVLDINSYRDELERKSEQAMAIEEIGFQLLTSTEKAISALNAIATHLAKGQQSQVTHATQADTAVPPIEAPFLSRAEAARQNPEMDSAPAPSESSNAKRARDSRNASNVGGTAPASGAIGRRGKNTHTNTQSTATTPSQGVQRGPSCVDGSR